MKKIALLSTLFFMSIVSSYAQRNTNSTERGGDIHHKKTPEKIATADYELSQFKGRWREEKRVNAVNKSVAFKDTIMIHFSNNDTVETRNIADSKMVLRVKGVAEIGSDNSLTTDATIYNIISVSTDAIVLKDNDDAGVTHYFVKSGVFNYELMDNGTAGAALKPSENGLVLSVANLLGDWNVYKREAKPGAVTNSTVVIKELNIDTKIDSNTASGTITIYKGGKSEQRPCTLTINDKNIKIDAGNTIFDFPVTAADGKELDFGNKEMMYYCKPM